MLCCAYKWLQNIFISIFKYIYISETTMERKQVEKKRRDNLKSLYNHLFSLLPTHISLGGMALPDQVGEAVNYIQTLQNQLEKNKQKKQQLLLEHMQQPNTTNNSRKRPHHFSSSSSSSFHSCINSTKPPLIQVIDIAPDIDVVLIDGLEDIAAFHNIIAILNRHGLEVSTAIFQPRGNSTLQILHQQQTKTVYEKLKQAVNGSSGDEPESLDSWDYDIWGFPILETSQGQLHNPPPY